MNNFIDSLGLSIYYESMLGVPKSERRGRFAERYVGKRKVCEQIYEGGAGAPTAKGYAAVW